MTNSRTENLAAGLVAADAGPNRADLDRILVQDLVLSCWIGVYEHEKEADQRVRFNLELLVGRNPVPVADDIDNVVCYDHVILGIKEILAAGHINLVETLAERIADLCLSEPRVQKAKIRVEKLDVLPGEGRVGVEIERHQVPHAPANLYHVPGTKAGKAAGPCTPGNGTQSGPIKTRKS